MYATRSLDIDIDQRVHLHDVSWQAYEALVAWRGERAVPRLTYLEGELAKSGFGRTERSFFTCSTASGITSRNEASSCRSSTRI